MRVHVIGFVLSMASSKSKQTADVGSAEESSRSGEGDAGGIASCYAGAPSLDEGRRLAAQFLYSQQHAKSGHRHADRMVLAEKEEVMRKVGAEE